MRRLISAPLVAMLALAPLAAAPRAYAQLFRRQPRSAAAPAAPVDTARPTTPGRGAYQFYRNGLDYLDKYGDAQRALQYFAEARRRQADLTPAERQQLADAWLRAERIVAGSEQASAPVARRATPRGSAMLADRRPPSLPPDVPELADVLRADRPAADPAVRVAATDATEPAAPFSSGVGQSEPTEVPSASVPPMMLEPDAPSAASIAPEPHTASNNLATPGSDAAPPYGDEFVVPVSDPPAQTPATSRPVAATPLTLESFEPEPISQTPVPVSVDTQQPVPSPNAGLPTPAPGIAEPVAATPLTLETLEAESALPAAAPPESLPQSEALSAEEPAPIDSPAGASLVTDSIESSPEPAPSQPAVAPRPDTGILLIPPPPRRGSSSEPTAPAADTMPVATGPTAGSDPVALLPELPATPADPNTFDPASSLTEPDSTPLPGATSPLAHDLPAPPPALPQPAPPEIAAASPGHLPQLPAGETAALPPAAEELPQLPGATFPANPAGPIANEDMPFPRVQIHRPEAMREVEELARRMDEEARRNPIVYPPPDQEDDPGFGDGRGSSDRNTALVPRAPSPTEARPIRAIPVPDAFVPMEERQFTPYRKYFAASANCYMPLYFQDAALERYGQSAEQALGPHWGRYFSYPLDDPRQTTQRNQLLQPFYSTGLFALQIAALPYHMIVDPPWEAQYDLGFHRPGDPTPPDLIYWPKHGIGPPGHGRRY